MSKKLYREYDNEGNLIKKECGKCGEIKTVDNFHKNKHTKDGYETICRCCKGVKKTNKRLYREYDKNGQLVKLECDKCGVIKTIDNFHKSKCKKDGYVTTCKQCRNKNTQKILYREYDNKGNLIKLECGKCGEIKTVDNFHKNKRDKDGYITTCKQCEGVKKPQKKLYREYDNEGNLIKLECSECREIKTVDNFHKSKQKKDGYMINCKQCEGIKNSKKILYREYDNEGNLIKLKCYKCGEIKTVDNFNKNKYSKNGYEYTCKQCGGVKKPQKISYREYDENGYLIKLECFKCGEIKTVDNFCKSKQKKDGYYPYCNSCRKQHYENNKDEILEKKHQYYENNKDDLREYKHQYNKTHKEERKEYNHKYHKTHKEEIREQSRKYRENIINEEIERIYKNVTKKLYPHNGIQYGIIYGVHCIPTDKWYIGQTTTSFNSRYKGNFFYYKSNELSENNIKGKLLQEDIEKYGQENFEIFEVIDVAFSERELDEKEAYYIDQYKAYDEGYNSTRGNIFKHNKLKRKEENDYQREGISRIC